MDRIFDIQNEILIQLQAKEMQLGAILDSNEPIVIRWQAFIGTILPIQITAIAKFGFSADQTGLSQFNDQLMKFNQGNDILKEINMKKWEYLLGVAFGLTSFRTISLEKARSLVVEISDEMTSESFLNEVDQISNMFDDSLSLSDRRKHLLEIIFPLHLRIMEKHDFEGDLGYVEAQRAIMDYYYDPVIMEKASVAQDVVFTRAKLK